MTTLNGRRGIDCDLLDLLTRCAVFQMNNGSAESSWLLGDVLAKIEELDAERYEVLTASSRHRYVFIFKYGEVELVYVPLQRLPRRVHDLVGFASTVEPDAL